MSAPIDLDSVVPCPWCSTPTTVIVEDEPFTDADLMYGPASSSPPDGECRLIQYPGDNDGGPWWLWWCHCGMESDEPTGFNGQPLPTYRNLYPALCAELEMRRAVMKHRRESRRASQDF